jgi:hypothetical protein
MVTRQGVARQLQTVVAVHLVGWMSHYVAAEPVLLPWGIGVRRYGLAVQYSLERAAVGLS